MPMIRRYRRKGFWFNDHDLSYAIVVVCSVVWQYAKTNVARIPDPRITIHPLWKDRDDNSKSMPMQYARQYARANTKCCLSKMQPLIEVQR
jgi:hypothetical protein